ncbi:MAG: vanadium-dependent haloperoxidase [Alphaproteobacteria bacterium]|nr:vanadium-dependent haloperoxidase [Alphaproteobacteria bacterium]
MTSIPLPQRIATPLTIVLGTTGALVALAATAQASEPFPRPEAWLTKSYADVAASPAPRGATDDRAALRRIVAARTAEDVTRFHWWATGGPTYRWNELMLEQMTADFVVLPMAARHLALFHAALDDAVMATRHLDKRADRREAAGIDDALDAARPSREPAPASGHAAAAIAAARVLGYLFPARADHFAALAEESIRSRLRAGAELPRAIEAGRAIGERVAVLAIAHGKTDRSDSKWTGTVPEGPDRWKGVNPIAPTAATWQTWVLATPAEFRPAPPPAVDSETVRGALAELKGFPRTPKSNHRALYWEVHGGARAHTLWNEIARTKLLEHGYGAATSARVLATLNVALADAGIACWDAKYAYWYIRPSQLDAELKPVFAPPNHPSYPAAHGCFSTAAATVLAHAFPRDAERLLALGKEAAEARIWAGIHYRFDIDVGQELGRKVAEKTIARAFVARTN